MPTITTDRLRLRGWRDDDLDAMAAINGLAYRGRAVWRGFDQVWYA